MTGLKHVESVKLDATPAGEPLYRKLGFIEEHKIIQDDMRLPELQSRKVPSKESVYILIRIIFQKY